jgi:uncharacterized membrane protein
MRSQPIPDNGEGPDDSTAPANVPFDTEDLDRRASSARPGQARPVPPDQLIYLRQETHSGPLPSAEYLERIERIAPGSVSRILKLTEDANKAQIDSEQREFSLRSRALNLAFVLAVFLPLLGLVLIETHQSIAGYTVFIGEVAYMVALFINSRRAKRISSADLDDDDEDEGPAALPQ